MFSTWQRGDIPPCHVENILQVVVDVAKGGHPSLPRQMPLQGVFDMAKEEHPSLLRRTHLQCVFKGGTPLPSKSNMSSLCFRRRALRNEEGMAGGKVWLVHATVVSNEILTLLENGWKHCPFPSSCHLCSGVQALWWWWWPVDR